ncbi:hypothetical protein ACRHK7_06615 [Weissella tructae]|uniref:hypothetical protein n=1 Tax=Weissella tructae TaxID=887702 RepID=UPI003D8C6B2F
MNDFTLTLRKSKTGESRTFSDVYLYPKFVQDWLQNDEYEITDHNLPFHVPTSVNYPTLFNSLLSIEQSGLTSLPLNTLKTFIQQRFSSYEKIELSEYEVFESDNDAQFAETFNYWAEIEDDEFIEKYLNASKNYFDDNGKWIWALVGADLRTNLKYALIIVDGFYLYEL